MAQKNTTVTAGTVTDVKVSASTVQALAAEYIKLQSAIDTIDAPKKWAWAKSVSEMLESTADKKDRTVKSEELGTVIGLELRGKAYSGPWVRLHCSAYAKFPNGFELDTNGTPNKSQVREFQAIVSGNAGKSKTEPKAPKEAKNAPSAENEELDSDGEIASDYLGKIRYAIKRALAAGMSVIDIEATCATAILELA